MKRCRRSRWPNTREVIAARYEREVNVREWCQCGKCDVEKLVGSLEYRCCREVIHTSGKMVFDGSIEHINCITEHEDYGALTNTTVLRQAGPLLKRKDGGYYRKKKNISENEYLRAVAYRWLIRWLCGYMGWDITRPLPACIYHNIKTRFESHQAGGYATALERD
eukprot:Seg1745.3 transcript_id=Seg1745.3/GoldUCD/mRNA.D3Y31 product="hypothetical protein" protein_id=Seg1745.3/GoldUCD/D3Y31